MELRKRNISVFESFRYRKALSHGNKQKRSWSVVGGFRGYIEYVYMYSTVIVMSIVLYIILEVQGKYVILIE